MQFMTVSEAATRWGITGRRVIALLNAGRVNGGVKSGKSWLIPVDTARPYDGRSHYAKVAPRAKRIAVVGANTSLGAAVSDLLGGNGYEVIGFSSDFDHAGSVYLNYNNLESMRAVFDSMDGYLDGLLVVDDFARADNGLGFDYLDFEREFREKILPMNFIVRELVKKMNYQSGVVLVNPSDENFVSRTAPQLSELYGIRINSITAKVDEHYISDLADDAYLLLTRHKYITGINIKPDMDSLDLDSRKRSSDMNSTRYYAWLHRLYSKAKPGDHIWVATKLSNKVEWVDNAMERQFKQDNMDAAGRGVKITRIFMFQGKTERKNKKNQNIRDYAANPRMNILWVDTDALKKQAPGLLQKIGDGWGGINDDILMVDLPSGEQGEAYGYVIMNQKDIADAKRAFNELKKFAMAI
ncbi:MAG: hypothetical protein FWD33_03740 [Alphaproteobacteria bacterium]|nr:hypothetical protein [Alphaproteobacteria bacterium]